MFHTFMFIPVQHISSKPIIMRVSMTQKFFSVILVLHTLWCYTAQPITSCLNWLQHGACSLLPISRWLESLHCHHPHILDIACQLQIALPLNQAQAFPVTSKTLCLTSLSLGALAYIFRKDIENKSEIIIKLFRDNLSGELQYFPVPPPIPAGLAGVLQESWGLCQTGRAWQDWDRVQQDFC